ncbi:MAG: hypothetical protein IKC35_03810 [Clostridia bacterium]|nr:hypothetical protein [Clostridia bacterium]
MNSKKCKCATYYSELIKKSGLVLPVFAALAMFAVLFYVRFVEMFADLKAKSAVAFWLFIVGAIIAIGLVVTYVVMGIKKEGLGARDTLLLTFNFLMVFLLLGMIIFNFVSMETVYYAIALVILVVLNVLRIMFAKVECTCGWSNVGTVLEANTTLSKYFSLVMEKFGTWKLFAGAFAILGGLLAARAWDLPTVFLSDVTYMVGILIVGAVAFCMFIIGALRRISTRTVDGVDAVAVLTLISAALSLLMLIGNFSMANLAIIIVLLIVAFAFILILSACTHNSEEETDISFFATNASKKFVSGPKVYLKKFVSSFNLFVLGAIAATLFVLFTALAATDFFAWAGANGFMLYAVIGILLAIMYELIYLGKNLKNPNIGLYDAILAVLDVAFLLLAITIFTNLSASGMNVVLFLWIVEMIILVAFTITRLFKVKEFLPQTEEEAQE